MKKIANLILICSLSVAVFTGCVVQDPDVFTPDARTVGNARLYKFTVQSVPIASEINATGEIMANENKSYTIHAISSGRIIRDSVILGQHVEQGETLAVIVNQNTMEAGAAARKTIKGGSGQEHIDRAEQVKGENTIISQYKGVVTKKYFTTDDFVKEGQILFEIFDSTAMWLEIPLNPNDIAKVSKGQDVIFKPYNFEGNKEFTGKIDSVSKETSVANALVNNVMEQLHQRMLGDVVIKSITGELPFVPNSAIQKHNGQIFVFVDIKYGKFKKQNVELGAKRTEGEEGYYIKSGLKPGDMVVSKGSSVLKAEMFGL